MIAVVGGTVMLPGFALIVLPGPAFLVIPPGLAIVATELLWARRWMKRVRGLRSMGVKRPPPALTAEDKRHQK